jgi:hypothetical protein
MRKSKWKLKPCVRITAIVILLNLLIPYQGYAEQPTQPPMNSSESGTRLYTDSEVETLIDEISQAALEAIEQAAGEAAKAAVLASLEREAAALREAQRWRIEAELKQQVITETKKAGTKNAVIAGLICFLAGLAVGTAIQITGNR